MIMMPIMVIITVVMMVMMIVFVITLLIDCGRVTGAIFQPLDSFRVGFSRLEPRRRSFNWSRPALDSRGMEMSNQRGGFSMTGFQFGGWIEVEEVKSGLKYFLKFNIRENLPGSLGEVENWQNERIRKNR